MVLCAFPDFLYLIRSKDINKMWNFITEMIQKVAD